MKHGNLTLPSWNMGQSPYDCFNKIFSFEHANETWIATNTFL